MRVAAAAIAKKWLRERYGVMVRGYLSQLGPIELGFGSWDAVDATPFFTADAAMVPRLESFMDELRRSGDSCGARITTIASNVPVGWGAPVYDKLDATLAFNMMSINASAASRPARRSSCTSRSSRRRASGCRDARSTSEARRR